MDCGAAESPGVLQRMGEHVPQMGHGELLQHEDLAAGQQRGIDFEGRVLRGGPDEDDAALLHIGEEGVLLGLVEPVDFVHEAEGAGAVDFGFFRLFHDFLDFLDAAGDGAEIHEAGLCAVRDDSRQGGLAHAGRPPEYHGGNQILLQHLPKNLALAQ